jgi:membrane-associated phospholipid phosphatase
MKNRRYTFSIQAIIAVLYVLSFDKTEAQNNDYQILKAISTHRSPSDTRFNHFISKTAPPITVGMPLLMYGIGLIEHDETLQKKSIEIGVAVAATVVESYALKYIVKRPRPYVTYPDLNSVDTEGTPSFPSGHSSGAFALATSLSLNYLKWYVVVPSFAWAGLTGYSRMYLGVHYPTDVLMGAAIGSGTAWLTWKANKAWQKKMTKKK